MANILNSQPHSDPVEIAPDIWWVGEFDTKLQCNPYLIIGSHFHVLIDSGSRPQFPRILMKILKLGIAPQTIGALVYQHYDPDLCGNIVDFVDIIKSQNLKIISDQINLPFISHYAPHADLLSTQSINHSIVMDCDKKIQFYNTPHSHSAGSIVTLEESTKTLFSSDLFGSHKSSAKTFLTAYSDCRKVSNSCPQHSSNSSTETLCGQREIDDLIEFHRVQIPCTKALMFALDVVEKIPFERIAPQHGSIIPTRQIADSIIQDLRNSGDFGIDRILNHHLHDDATRGMRFS